MWVTISSLFHTVELWSEGDEKASTVRRISSRDREVKVRSLSQVWLFATPGTVACQAALSMGSSRQEYWSGLPFPSLFPSSQSRDWTQFSCIAGGFFTHLNYLGSWFQSVRVSLPTSLFPGHLVIEGIRRLIPQISAHSGLLMLHGASLSMFL